MSPDACNGPRARCCARRKSSFAILAALDFLRPLHDTGNPSQTTQRYKAKPPSNTRPGGPVVFRAEAREERRGHGWQCCSARWLHWAPESNRNGSPAVTCSSPSDFANAGSWTMAGVLVTQKSSVPARAPDRLLSIMGLRQQVCEDRQSCAMASLRISCPPWGRDRRERSRRTTCRE